MHGRVCSLRQIRVYNRSVARGQEDVPTTHTVGVDDPSFEILLGKVVEAVAKHDNQSARVTGIASMLIQEQKNIARGCTVEMRSR
jgi:hypothetical protein